VKILKVSVLVGVLLAGVGMGMCDAPKKDQPAGKDTAATTAGKSTAKTDTKAPAQKGGTAGKKPAPPSK
jgi:hypothetical protein